VSRFDSLEQARRIVERALRDHPTLLVIDNFESVSADPDPGLILMLAALSAIADTRVLLTGREPAPASLGAIELQLGALAKRDGRALVEQVLRRETRAPKEEPNEPADTPWIDELVEAVGGHSRSLVLLAPMIADLGAGMTREKLSPLMAELERRHPGNRENSLLASVRLSLTRLPPKQREQVRALAIFHGAVDAWRLARVLEVEMDEALALCRMLVNVGLAEAEGSYLLPDPALGIAVIGELGLQERKHMESRWLAASASWVHFLYEQQFKEASVASAGVRHALGELLAVVAVTERAVGADALSAEDAFTVVRSVEQILEDAGIVRAIGLVAATRQRLANRVVGWSSAAFASRGREVEHQMRVGELTKALAGARELHQRARAAGAGAYENAAYDMALSSSLLAQVLIAAGRADEALAAAAEAEQEFRNLAVAGRTGASGMAASSLSMRADALTNLGRLDEAATAYEKAVQEADVLGAQREAAAMRFQLGTVRILQRRYADAIAAFDQARRTFEDLGEPGSVAAAWHQIGVVHRNAGRFDAAESAYLRSLDIKTRLEDRSGQASTLGELGNLYHASGRPEESADHLRRAADVYAALGDQRNEGAARNNLANCLHGLQRYNAARVEAERAIELKREFGHAATPWTAWAVLSHVEHKLGDTEAAAIARQRAIDTYAAYRRDGGYPQRPTGRVAAQLTAALSNGTSPRQLVAQLASPPGAAANVAAFLTCLRAILSGDRNPTLLGDPALDFDDVAELTLLLETLSSPGRPGQA